jgi:hypothetical protein
LRGFPAGHGGADAAVGRVHTVEGGVLEKMLHVQRGQMAGDSRRLARKQRLAARRQEKRERLQRSMEGAVRVEPTRDVIDEEPPPRHGGEW